MTDEIIKPTPLKINDVERILDFQKILDKIAQNGDGKFHAKLKSKYSPTELCGCLRNAWYSRIFPIPYDADSYRAFLFGNIVHELFQKNLDYPDRYKVFKETELLERVSFVESEKGFHYLLPFEKTGGKRVVISGRLDTIFFLKGADKPIIVDYKTTKDIKYNMSKPKDAHVSQVNFYLGCTLGDHGIIVYIDKRDFKIVQHTIDYSHTKFEDMINFAVILDNAIETKTCPKINKSEIAKEGYCSYCKYAKECKAEEEKYGKKFVSF
jgi:hypothetical protein